MKAYTVYLFVFVLLLSGCSLMNKQPGSVSGDIIQLANEAGTVTCSERCELKSQCGIVDGDNQVIMGRIDQPAVEPINMDMMLADKTAVFIITSQLRTVQKTSGDQPTENIYFYNVTANDGSNKSGWIAGWCVEALPPTE